jgi:hypothetical protein
MLKYSGDLITGTNEASEEIDVAIAAGNRFYYGL